ncbi:hypothetical protein [Hymenobacter fodinae]|uniref:Outer membrane protein with beta-barrel domain n=1 Tax=Hymenobacter fodinae TaxID=2510796 RepID=A0A4Z0P2I2_9BACT|nr:hypothetical protein [Hymenobacter fodinae]TGE05210.1 hypothetical protein EU556_18000 [Hymenobacter fodinae]
MRLLSGVLLVGTILLSIPSHAQRILLGLKGGAAIANGIGTDAKNSSLRFGGQGGALLRVKLTEQLAIQGEGLYVQRGDNGTLYGRTIGHRLDYISALLLLQYHFADIFVEAGPQLNWLRTATPNIVSAQAINTLTFQDQDRSFVVGFGYQDTTGVTVGWRYIGGLSNVFNPSPISGSRQLQLRNSTVEFYLGYLFEPRQIIRFITSPVRLVKSIGSRKSKAARQPANQEKTK